MTTLYVKSIKELMELEKTGAELTPEETERLAEHRRKKAAQHKAWRERQKAGQPKARTLKELAAAQKEGKALTPEESERLEAHNADYYGIPLIPILPKGKYRTIK